jgi:hypothetical protein
VKQKTRSGRHRAAETVLWVLLAVPIALFGVGPAQAGGAHASPGGAVTSAASAPRVVLIVGPVGALTARFRQLADAAADEARRYTDLVTTIYSPNATWPAVRSALQGASIVVYLGHGNGWPSRYRNSPFGATQNGLGLNPRLGVSNDAHQYFGESFLEKSVRLAPGAVVLLHHLCYASGNSEPGLPEGSLDVAKQRVDNYAAGWLATGAAAVVAEGHLGPAYYIRSLLATGRHVESIWRSSPNFHGHILSMPSVRTQGATAYLDPDRPTAGFYRSLVLRSGAGVGIQGGLATASGGLVAVPAEPSLARPGTTFSAPSLASAVVAGGPTSLRLQFKLGRGAHLPKGVGLSLRWTTLGNDPPLAVDGPGAQPESGASPGQPLAGQGGPPMDYLDPPEVDLVVPEMPDQVVEPQPAVVAGNVLRLSVDAPPLPGLYRLVTTIHDTDGIPFDAATQSLIPGLVVRVTPALSAHYGVVRELRLTPGRSFDLPVRVLNSGRVGWGETALGSRGRPIDSVDLPWLVARWLPLGGSTPASDGGRTPAIVAPGENKVVTVRVTVPPAPDDYLLVLDVEVPGFGPLAARGVAPGLVRVHVAMPAARDVTSRRPAP